MKHLLKHKIYEHSNALKSLISKEKEKGNVVDDSDISYFKELTKSTNTPNNLYRLIKWLFNGENPSDLNVVYEYYINLRNLNLKVPNINKYNKSEDLFDSLQIIERNYKVNKIIQELPSILKKQYKSIDDTNSIDSLFLNLYEKKNKDQLISKISRYKNLDDLCDIIEKFLDSSNGGFVEKILSLNDDKGSKVIYSKNKIIVAEITDYKSSSKNGSSAWCISTQKSYFDSYTNRGRNKQLFIWDFNLKINDPHSLIGMTMKPFSSILRCPDEKSQISDCHDRNDGSLLNNYGSHKGIIEILKDKKIPLDLLFFNKNGNEDMVVKFISKGSVVDISHYLLLNDSSIIKNRLLSLIKTTFDINFITKLNIELSKSWNDKLENKYINQDTLKKYLDKITKEDPDSMIEICKKENFGFLNAVKYYIECINGRLSTKKMIDEFCLLTRDGTSYLPNNITKVIRKNIIDKISMEKNLDIKFDCLVYWRDGSGFPREYKVLLSNISKKYNFLNSENKVKALIMIKKSYEASTYLSNISINNKLSISDILHRIFTHKPKAIEKSKFLDNIISFISKFNTDEINKYVTDFHHGHIDLNYFGKKLFTLYDLLGSNMVSKNYMFSKCIEEHDPKLSRTDIFIQTEIGFKIMNDENYSKLNLNDRELLVSTILRNANNKQISDNINIIDKEIEIHKNNYRLPNLVISTGSGEMIEKYKNDLNKYFNSSSSIQSSDPLYLLLESEKMSLSDFLYFFDIISKSDSDTPERSKELIWLMDGDKHKLNRVIKEIISDRSDKFNIKYDDTKMGDIFDKLMESNYSLKFNKNRNIKKVIKHIFKLYPIYDKDFLEKYKSKKSAYAYSEIYKYIKLLMK